MSDQQTLIPDMPIPINGNHQRPSTYVHDLAVVSGVDRETVCKVLEAIDYVNQPTPTFSGGKFSWGRSTFRRGSKVIGGHGAPNPAAKKERPARKPKSKK